MTNAEDRLLTAKEVGDRLSLGKSKVYQMLKDQQIPSIRLGGSVRVLESELRRWLDSLPRSGVSTF